MKEKTKRLWIRFFQSSLIALFNIAVLFMFSGFFLVYINSNMESFKRLPNIIKIFIPIGYIACIFKILTINFTPFKFGAEIGTKSQKGENK